MCSVLSLPFLQLPLERRNSVRAELIGLPSLGQGVMSARGPFQVKGDGWGRRAAKDGGLCWELPFQEGSHWAAWGTQCRYRGGECWGRSTKGGCPASPWVRMRAGGGPWRHVHRHLGWWHFPGQALLLRAPSRNICLYKLYSGAA